MVSSTGKAEVSPVGRAEATAVMRPRRTIPNFIVEVSESWLLRGGLDEKYKRDRVA